MKHRYMEGDIYIGSKGNISGSKHVYEGVKCHVSHTVSEDMRTLGVDQSNATTSITNFIIETQSHY